MLRLAGAAGLVGIGGVQAGLAQESDDTSNGCRLGEETAAWTVDAAEQIELDDTNTVPVVDDINEAAPGLHVWDTWPLRNRDGSVATVNGWSIQFALTSPDEVLPGKRHDIAEIRYFYSRDGRNWQLGGPVFVSGTAKGSRQWAASAVWDDETEEMFMFYTATGRSGNPTNPRADGIDISYEQRLALAEGATIETTTSGVDIEGMWEHEIILTADGEYYQTQEQAGDDIIYAFRDPYYFEDPESGCQYLIFEGNTPTDPDETDCEAQALESGDYTSGVAATGAQFNGNVGLAVSTADDDDMSEWELRPPLLDAVCVNQQLERGNIVTMNDKYYLFVDSHKFTFPAGLDGPDGMYGFVADSLRGDYEPLNGSGLVLANPADEPFQTYSWMPVPYEDDQIAVLSYFNYFDLGDNTLTGVGSMSREEQQEKFGGTFAPTVVVELDGTSTEIVDTLDPGFLPSEYSNPPIGSTEEESDSGFEIGEPAHWKEEDVAKIELTDDNTAPVIDGDPVQISEDRLVWDTWALRNRDGSVAEFDGWQVIFSLTADPTRPEVGNPQDRHPWARIAYFYSRNGQSAGEEGWEQGGVVFEGEDWYGNQQWAGSAMYDPDEEQIYHFYTAAEDFDGSASVQEAPGQRLALAKGHTVETSEDGVDIVGDADHYIIGEADGEMYEQLNQSSGILYSFRDPWYFRHPETGEDLIVFEGNTPTESDDPNDPMNFNGNVGVARATNDELTEWELLPPILEAVGVSQQLERPHYIFQDGTWYLFFITHSFTYAPDLDAGPEAIHGFAADGLYDPDMQPLNGSSLVVANPPEAPVQAYSWNMIPWGEDAVVQSFTNWPNGDDEPFNLGEMTDAELREAFGGTLAPSLEVGLDDTETQILSELPDGFIPASRPD